MALQSIVNSQAPAPDKSALQNAYKAFDLAKTLGSIYGTADTMWATKAPNLMAFQSQAPSYGLGGAAQGQSAFQLSPMLRAYGR